MKHIHFDIETDGFYGAYWACAGADCALIAMLGDDPEDHTARSGVKWLLNLGVNVMTMSPAGKDYGHHNYPLERIETAIAWLKAHGNRRIGIAGASTTGTLALTAASMFPELTLTIAMTPSDFVWQGFMQGKRDGCGEWPVEGESLFSYRGKPLPYILTKPFLLSVGMEGVVIAAATITAFYLGLSYGGAAAGQTMAFSTLCLSRLFHGFSCKSQHPVLLTQKFWNNRALLGAFAAGSLLLGLVLFVPALEPLFSAAPLSIGMIGAVVGLAFCSMLTIQLLKRFRR